MSRTTSFHLKLVTHRESSDLSLWDFLSEVVKVFSSLPTFGTNPFCLSSQTTIPPPRPLPYPAVNVGLTPPTTHQTGSLKPKVRYHLPQCDLAKLPSENRLLSKVASGSTRVSGSPTSFTPSFSARLPSYQVPPQCLRSTPEDYGTRSLNRRAVNVPHTHAQTHISPGTPVSDGRRRVPEFNEYWDVRRSRRFDTSETTEVPVKALSRTRGDPVRSLN